MPFEADEATFALVVPEECAPAALRVSRRVRYLLRVEIFVVDRARGVRRTDEPPRPAAAAETQIGVPVAAGTFRACRVGGDPRQNRRNPTYSVF
jgi:hypothetical protein